MTASYWDESYPPSIYAPPAPPPGPDKGSASPGDSFNEPTITAEDATNAAKLAGLGFVADPLTAWIETQGIAVSGFIFHWTGSDWHEGTG